MSYFECNLPDSCPHICAGKRSYFEDTVKVIKARMAKLDDALAKSGMDGAAFAKTAKILFDNSFDLFERMDSVELAMWVQNSYDGKPVEHRFEWPNAEVVVDCAFVQTKEWEALRHFGIGGSDAAAIRGESRYKTAQETYHDKVGTPELIPSNDAQAIFERGHIMEDRVIDAFLKLTGFKRIPETRMFRSRKYPHQTANIDGIVISPDDRIFVFEAKTTVAENWDAWKDGKIPRSYVPQTRQYPAVLDDDRVQGTYIGCLFIVDLIVGGLYVGSAYSGEQFVARCVERDKLAEDDQLANGEEWWNTYVEPNVEPEASGIPKKDIEVIRTYHSGYADPSADAVDMTHDLDMLAAANEWLTLGENRAAKQKEVDAIKERQDAISELFMLKLNDAVEGRINLPDNEFMEVKWSPRSRTNVDMETLKIRFPDAYNQCVSVNPESSRVFSIKRKKVRTRKK